MYAIRSYYGHVPSDAEWTVLSDYLGGESVAGGKLKEAGTTHWYTPNAGATNETGFTALPGGIREAANSTPGLYCYESFYCHFWTSTDLYSRELRYFSGALIRVSYYPAKGFSIRCIKD